MKTLVTGGLGFVGSKIVESLIARGEELRVLSLPMLSADKGHCGTCETILGDIRDASVVRRAVKGCDRIYHLAGYARNWSSDPAAFFAVNVEGTDTILRAAAECDVREVVYTSSNLALGPSNGRQVDESHPRTADFFTEYERSKFVAENLVRAYVRKGLHVVIVNPTRIYGPGPLDESNSVTKMIAWYLQGKWRFVLGDGTAVGNYVLVDDVVRGHLLAMDRGRSGENYILGGQDASFTDFFAILARISNVRHRLVHLRSSLALCFANIEKARASISRHYPLITPGWTRTFLTNWENSCAKARQELGYRPASLEAGMKLTVRWLQQYGVV